MSELRFEAAGSGALLRADARLEAGLWVTVSQSAPALASLVALASGVEPPALGRVLLDGAPPSTSPAARRRIAALLAFEFLPPGGSVRGAVARVLSARGDVRDADSLLARLGFVARAKIPVNELDAAERRSLALGLALHHEQARLFALFEPLAANHGLEPDEIRRLLAARVEAGAIVLVATSNPDAAASLGGARLEIQNGVLCSAVPTLAPVGAPSVLYVETREPQRLVTAVAGDPAVSGVAWNEAQLPHLVALHGPDLEALAAALARAASEAQIPLDRVSHSATPPPAASPAESGLEPPAAQPAALFDPQAARPPDQSVVMPTAFAEPTRPGGPREGS